MADFEDSTSPTWLNLLDGQINLRDAIKREIGFKDSKTGKEYKLNENIATLIVRLVLFTFSYTPGTITDTVLTYIELEVGI